MVGLKRAAASSSSSVKTRGKKTKEAAETAPTERKRTRKRSEDRDDVVKTTDINGPPSRRETRHRKATTTTTADEPAVKFARVQEDAVVEAPQKQQAGRRSVVLTVGEGDIGQLGLGEDVVQRRLPASVDFGKKLMVVDVCAGGLHTVCLTDDGEIHTFGCNDEGTLGRDTSEESGNSEYLPGKVDVPERVVQATAGDSHTAVLTDRGSVFVWGNFRDANGNIGLAAAMQKQTKPLCLLDGVKKIASGSDHLIMLKIEGQLYSCGYAEVGQLGRVAEHFADRGGRKGLAFLLTPKPVNLPKRGGKQPVFDDIWAGFYTTFARSTTGDIYACGLNNYSQLGLEDKTNQYVLQKVPSLSSKTWVQMAAGLNHTLALDDKGEVHVFGRSDYGRLGLGKESGDQKQPVPIPALRGTRHVDIACGSDVSFCVAENGAAYAWGMGSSGQLGMGEDEVWEPRRMTGKQLEGDRKVAMIRTGAQHSVILAFEDA